MRSQAPYLRGGGGVQRVQTPPKKINFFFKEEKEVKRKSWNGGVGYLLTYIFMRYFDDFFEFG